MMRSMVIDMNDEQLPTLAQMQAFLDGTVAAEFAVAVEERYGFIGRTVLRLCSSEACREGRGAALPGAGQRLFAPTAHPAVKWGCEEGRLIKRYRGSRTSFARTYTSADALLLAHTDSLHGTLSGLATKKLLMERAFDLFREVRYKRLAGISLAHLYNLRQRESYQRQVWTKTRPGEHRHQRAARPSPQQPTRLAPRRQPASMRSGRGQRRLPPQYRGLVTQYEGVATCEHISEAFLIPVLEALLQSFPLRDPRLPQRQRLGIHQPPGRQAAQQVAHPRANQITLAAQ